MIVAYFSVGKGLDSVIDIPCDESELWYECCIYRVPKKLRQVNEEAYTPKLVSIGPFHHDLEELLGVKMQKQIYWNKFFFRTSKSKKDLKSIIESNKEKIRRSYSETFHDQLTDEDFVNKILFDAIFIIELFLRNFERQKYCNDYILSNAWLESHIKQDLILLENQLPFKYLQMLYNSAFELQKVTPFLKLSCHFFFSDKHRIPIDSTEVKHFTDLHRMFYSPTKLKDEPKKLDDHLRYTATKLDEAGLQFKALVDTDFSKKSLLDIEFHKHKYLDRFPCFNLSWLFSCLPCLKSCCFKHVNCLIKIPQLVIDDHTKPLFRNLMALEQYHYPSNTYICNYVLLLDSLITTKADVCLLVRKKVIDNRCGSSEAVTTLVNKLGHQIIERESCYRDIYQRLNEHCDNCWNSHMASLKSVYFRDFWRGTATVAGILALGFTFGNFLTPFVMKH